MNRLAFTFRELQLHPKLLHTHQKAGNHLNSETCRSPGIQEVSNPNISGFLPSKSPACHCCIPLPNRRIKMLFSCNSSAANLAAEAWIWGGYKEDAQGISGGDGKIQVGFWSSQAICRKIVGAGSLFRGVVGTEPNSARAIGYSYFRHPFPPFSHSNSIKLPRLQWAILAYVVGALVWWGFSHVGLFLWYSGVELRNCLRSSKSLKRESVKPRGFELRTHKGASTVLQVNICDNWRWQGC